MPEELLYSVNENGEPIEPVQRSTAHADGIWHRTAHVWVIAPDVDGGSLLFQRRSQQKDVAPGLLDVSVGGHLAPGEDTREAACRELEEELGISINPGGLTPLGVRQTAGRFTNVLDREFQTIFGINLPGDVSQIRPQVEEISAVNPVPITAGLALFSGALQAVTVSEYPAVPGGLGTPASNMISLADFISNRDGYYYRALVMARRWLNGEDHLVV